MSPVVPDPPFAQSENDRLVRELEQAEAYEQKLRQFFVDIRAELAAGRAPATMVRSRRA